MDSAALLDTKLPRDFHLRHAGLQTLTLTRVTLDSAGFQELGKLGQLQQLSLIGIQTSAALQLPDRPFAHFTESLQFSAGLDSLHSILPHTDRTDVETLLDEAFAHVQQLQQRTQQLESDLLHAFRTTQSFLDPVDKALESLSQLIPNPSVANTPKPPCHLYDTGDETAAMLEQALHYTVELQHRTQQLGSGPPEAVQMIQPATASVAASNRVDSDSPFGCLSSVTSLKLSEYTSADFPALDLLGMTQLRNLKHLTLLEIWGVDVPYCELASLSKLTFLETDMSQSEDSWQSLPALTHLQRLSVACARPDMPQFQLYTEFTNLLGLTRLDLTEVENFLPEQLESLKVLPALEHFAVVGKNMPKDKEEQPYGWQHPIDWKALSGLTALKHLALINIDHKDGIFKNICSLTCLTFLDLFSLRKIYKSRVGEKVMLLSSLPSLDHLHCEFYI